MDIFPFSYTIERGLEVNNQTEAYLKVNPDIQERIIQLSWIYHTLGKTIPQTTENYWSGHYFPYVQSLTEIQISQNLCFVGLYKQAFVSLRSALELGLLSVYYNINDEGHEVVQNWLMSESTYEANTPKADRIWKILLSNKNIKEFNDRFNLRKSFDKLGYLHDYVHSKGSIYSNDYGIGKSNSQTFEKDLLIKWIECLNDIVSIVCTLHILKYPISIFKFDYTKKFGVDTPSFGGLQEFEIDRMAKILPVGYFEAIEKLAKTDEQTQGYINWITSLPDLTNEDVEEQIINLEKFFIKNGDGFILWEQQQHRLYGDYINDPDGIILNRIQILRKWAEENDFMKPKFERLGIKFEK